MIRIVLFCVLVSMTRTQNYVSAIIVIIIIIITIIGLLPSSSFCHPLSPPLPLSLSVIAILFISTCPSLFLSSSYSVFSLDHFCRPFLEFLLVASKIKTALAFASFVMLRLQYGSLYLLACITHLFIHSPLTLKSTFSHSFTHSY